MSDRFLVFCLSLSIILHLILLKGIPFALPKFKINTPIEIQLKFLQPTPAIATPNQPQAQIAKKIIKTKPKSKPSKPKPEPKPKPKPKLKPKPKPKPKLKPEPKPELKPEVEQKNSPPVETTTEAPEKIIETPTKFLASTEVKPKITIPVQRQNYISTSVSGKNIIPKAYLNAIRLRIEQHKEYPLLARRNGIEGKVVVIFFLQNNGHLIDVKIETSSGFSMLDKAALNAIKKAAPFPPFPQKLNRNILTLKLPICFKLKICNK